MNRYDILDSYRHEKKDTFHLDVAETAFFKRQLEYIRSTTYDTKYRNLKAMELIPVSTETPPGADYVTWYSYSQAGIAKIISDYAHDFPRVDIYATENQSRVYSLGDAYGYSIKEVRRAAMAGVNLNTRRATMAKRAIDELMDKLAWFGDDDHNIQGFLNYPGISEYITPAGVSTSTLWPSKTPDEIVADLTGLADAVSVPTNGREEINVILLPRARYNLIKNTRMTDGDSKTILTFFTENNPGIEIMVLDELTEQGDGGSERMMGYVRDAEHLVQEIPQPFEQLEPDKKGATWEVPCHAEYGGVTIFYPQSVAFADNI